MRIGILTGGGDTASLNAIIYGVAETAELYGNKVIGFERGWKGVLTPTQYRHIKKTEIDSSKGGTMLRTSRTKLTDVTSEEAADNISKVVDGLIAIGGDDTLTVGKKLLERMKIPVCFITKTVDNDVGINAPEGKIDYEKIINYFTSGFAAAAYKAANYASELRTTAYSHERIMFLEAMGRSPGWLALSAYKGQPDFILVPEVAINFERFKEMLAQRYTKNNYAVVVVAEGVHYEGSEEPISQDRTNQDSFGNAKLGGVAEILAKRIKKELAIENCNDVNPNYLYRSGSPTLFEKLYAMELGKSAATTIAKQVTGLVAILQRVGNKIEAQTKPLESVVKIDQAGKIIPRNLDLRFYDPDNYCITDEGREYFRVIR